MKSLPTSFHAQLRFAVINYNYCYQSDEIHADKDNWAQLLYCSTETFFPLPFLLLSHTDEMMIAPEYTAFSYAKLRTPRSTPSYAS